MFFLGYTKLIIIGGYNSDDYDGYLSNAEVIDLESSSSTCDPIADYPVNDTGMAIGIIDGLIKSCGSQYDSDICFDYSPATKSWSTSVSMLNARYYPRASFIDGVWLLSGDYTGSDDDPYSTEMWTGSGFAPGPTLPRYMEYPCQLTVNSTHVFFTDSWSTDIPYLLDWYSQTWTELPPPTVQRLFPSCGLINNPENGHEVVIVEDGVSEILNLRTMTWRMGPSLPSFDNAGFTQLRETFVVVGGETNSDHPIGTIYQFDHINYDWILKSQKLQVARTKFPSVVAAPDIFVSCS